MLNGRDEPSIRENKALLGRAVQSDTPGYDLDLLHKFAKTFPESAMTDFIDDYCRWFQLPLPEPEAEPETDVNADEQSKAEKPSKKEKLQRWRKKKRGPNARERRKARRQAGKEGVLAENVDQEEREELISSMTASLPRKTAAAPAR